MAAWEWVNRFVDRLPGDPETGPRRRQVGAAWSSVMPTPVAAPRVVAVSADMLHELGLGPQDAASPVFVQVFGGNRCLPGMQPHAGNYGGHQFGSWAGQLGDGRAITLGEIRLADGQCRELQLKGAGPTPYSRHADGRAVLRSSIREFICSEAMHHLGIPTTRALALVATGEGVVRDMFYDGNARAEPGAIVTRVAPSFLRFGHFELPASRGDIALLRQLADFCIERDFPHLAGRDDALPAWFREIAGRTAWLVAEWMRVGFVHGVMNTDNMSTSGLTIDYGPYGWIDAYDPDFTPNTTDAHGRRYRFGWQPRIALWNLQQLAAALSPLFPDPAPLQQGLRAYGQAFAEHDRDNAARKLGLETGDAEALPLMRALQAWMHKASADMTIFFRLLGEEALEALDAAHFAAASREGRWPDAQAEALDEWLARYRRHLKAAGVDAGQRRETLRRANPAFIPRNWLLQQAIERAEAGDDGGIQSLLEAMRTPYEDVPGRDVRDGLPPDWSLDKAGCSMLSCSS